MTTQPLIIHQRSFLNRKFHYIQILRDLLFYQISFFIIQKPQKYEREQSIRRTIGACHAHDKTELQLNIVRVARLSILFP